MNRILFSLSLLAITFFIFQSQESNNSLQEKNTFYLQNKAIAVSEKSQIHKDSLSIDSVLILVKVLVDSAQYDSALVQIVEAEKLTMKNFEKQSVQMAVIHYTRGDVYLRINDLPLSLKSLNKANDILSKNADAMPEIHAKVYSCLGVYNAKQGKYGEAEKYYFKSLDICEKYLGEAHERTGATLHNIGLLFQQRGIYDKALKYSFKALETRKKALNKNHHDIGMTNHNIGLIYLSTSDLKNASKYTNKALEIRKVSLPSSHPDIADSYLNLGLIEKDRKNFQNALDYYYQAYEIYKLAFGENHRRIALTLDRIGALYNSYGMRSAGTLNLEKALEIKKNVFPEDHIEIGIAYHNIGSSLLTNNNIKKSISYHQKSIRIFKKIFGLEHLNVGIALNSLANAYTLDENYDEALLYLKKSFEVKSKFLKENDLGLSNLHEGFGMLYQKMEKYDLAFDSYEKSKTILIHNFGMKHPDVATSIHNQALIRFSQGKLQEAKILIVNAIKIQEEAQKIDFIKLTNSQLELVSILEKEEKLQEALQENDKILSWLKYKTGKTINTDKLVKGLTQRAKILKKIDTPNNLLLAQEFENEALAMLYKISKNYSENSFRQSLFEKHFALVSQAIDTNIQLYEANKEKKYLDQLYVIFEKNKAFALKNIYNKNNIQVSSKPLMNLNLEERELKNKLSKIEKNKFEMEASGHPNEKIDSLDNAYSNNIFAINESLDSIQNVYKRDYEKYFRLNHSDEILAISELQNDLLIDRQSLINYFVGKEFLYISCINNKKSVVEKVPLNMSLNQLVSNFRESIYRPFSEKLSAAKLDSLQIQYVESAYELYQKLILPIEDKIGDKEELIIIPDGVIGYIPFDALLSEKPTNISAYQDYPYLLKKYQTSISYSATLLKEMKDKKHKLTSSKSFLGVAPRFEGGGADTTLLAARSIDVLNDRNRLSALKENVNEVKNIQQIVGGDLLINENATEANFVDQASGYQLIHLSTHGKANDQVGDYSFLAFYELKDSLENEWLYNKELYELDLNADMVVLSACETGIGELQKGEGIISLARGFSYAGAKSIITSLWNVDDGTTPEIMNYFYSNLKENMPKDKALREAKLQYLNNTTNPEPYFWATFIPIGDMTALDLKTSTSNWIWLTFGIILFGLLAFSFLKFKSA